MEPKCEATEAGAVSLDISRAVREGQSPDQARPLAVAWADVEACVDRITAAHKQLHDGTAAGSGFLSLDWEGWASVEAEQLAERLGQETDTLLVVGMGGSALGARTIAAALTQETSASSSRRVEVLDTVDPSVVREVCGRLNPRRTAVVAISKSGSTVEALALVRVLTSWLRDSVGELWSSRVAVVTESGESLLGGFASEHGISTLPVPGHVGGRFSVLTAVGQLPAAYMGVNCAQLRQGADAMKARVQVEDLNSNPSWQWAAVHDAWVAHAPLSTLLIYGDQLGPFGRWFRQLVSESLGKRDADGVAHGLVPVVGRGPADQHSQLQLWTEGPRNSVFTVARIGDLGGGMSQDAGTGPAMHLAPWLGELGLAGLLDAQCRGTTAALIEGGLPVVELSIPKVDAHALGELFVLYETAVALLGLSWGIDPFDQPGVELAKRFTAALLGGAGLESERHRVLALLARPEHTK